MTAWPSAEAVAKHLGGARRSGDGWQALCPCHEDKTPSLSIHEADDGCLLVKCHAGCAQNDIVTELRHRGLWRHDSGPSSEFDPKPLSPIPSTAPKPDFRRLCAGEPSSTFEYRDPTGKLLGYICRVDTPGGGKRFVPITFGPNEGRETWRQKGFPVPRPLYGLDRLARRPSAPVLVVEGEKAADAAQALLPDYVVTTWPNGANSVGKADWSPLADRDVVIWPDADQPGEAAASEVAKFADKAGAKGVRIVQLPKYLTDGWDLADAPPESLDIGRLIAVAEEVDDTLVPFILSARELMDAEIPVRGSIIDPWLPEASLSMVYAKRGVGKTWFAMSLGLAVARGEPFLGFTNPKSRRVLYVEGEMPLADIQNRLRLLNGPETDDLIIVASELLFRAGRRVNLNNLEDQEVVDRTLARLERKERRADLIIIDNLSSLGGGIDENDNSALDRLLEWMLRLRHAGYAVLMVHHAGKSGDQRGASRREDLLDTTIRLEVPKDYHGDSTGAAFDLEFTKTRGVTPNPRLLRLSLRPNEEGRLEWQMEEVKPKVASHIETLLMIYRGAGRGPFQQQSDLARKIGLSKAAISQHMKQLRTEGLVGEVEGDLLVTEKGVKALTAAFGEKRLPSNGWMSKDPDLQSKLDFR